MASSASVSPWAATARALYLVAMAVFLVTIGIGILNGLDAVEFDRNQLLTHVHSGTVGWLTLAIVATTFLAYRAADTRLAATLAVCVPVYVLAFYTGNFAFRAISGVALLLAIGWLLAWTWRTYLAGERTLPRLGLALALTTFTYGAVVGVLLQVGFAAGTAIVPGDGIGAHAGAMTFGYLVLAGMAVAEWRVLGTRGLPRGGIVQMGALFLGGFILSVALLVGAPQLGGMLYLLAELVAVVLFVVRILPRAVRGIGGEGEPAHLALASLWIVVALALFMYLVTQFVSNPDPAAINAGLLVGSDHAVYIGVITNSVFALLATLLGVRAGSALLRAVVQWGMNAGLAVFVIGLVADVVVLKQIGAPVMGACLLLGIALYGAALLAARAEPAPDALAAPA
ncbi:MAG TPA: hypothetical protein VFY23_14035 [Candidatus Limnocylindrales bacterium]|nr:hypothetical protein [Candidatus Limnocylindrales bacterium]